MASSLQSDGKVAEAGIDWIGARSEENPLWRACLELALKWLAGWLERLLMQLKVDSATDDGGAPSVNRQDMPPTPVIEAGSVLDAAREIVRLVNEERAAAGLPQLAMDERLMEIARKRAMEVVTDWGHQGLSDDCGTCGENLGQVPRTIFSPAGEVSAWMTSPKGHRENILHLGVSRIGAGVYRATTGHSPLTQAA